MIFFLNIIFVGSYFYRLALKYEYYAKWRITIISVILSLVVQSAILYCFEKSPKGEEIYIILLSYLILFIVLFLYKLILVKIFKEHKTK